MFKSMVVSFYLSALFPLSQRLMLTARTGLCGELRQMLPQLFLIRESLALLPETLVWVIFASAW